MGSNRGVSLDAKRSCFLPKPLFQFCLSYCRLFPPKLPDYKSGALLIELNRLRSKTKTVTYYINTTRVEHLAILPGYGSIGILPSPYQKVFHPLNI